MSPGGDGTGARAHGMQLQDALCPTNAKEGGQSASDLHDELQVAVCVVGKWVQRGLPSGNYGLS